MTVAKPSRAERTEGFVLVVILLVVGTLAGLASFTHVHDWTMDNSPTDTPDWFGWANAAISELIPTAALLTIRRRKRMGGPIGYPMFLLICAVALSLAAQLAVAKPGLSGWLLSAVPALAFLGLSKLVLSTHLTLATVPAPVPAGENTSQSEPVIVPDGSTEPAPSSPEPSRPAVPDTPAVPVAPIVPASVPVALLAPPLDPAMLAAARRVADEHRASTGRDITRDELRAVLRVSNATASDLLRTLRATAVNGHQPAALIGGGTTPNACPCHPLQPPKGGARHDRHTQPPGRGGHPRCRRTGTTAERLHRPGLHHRPRPVVCAGHRPARAIRSGHLAQLRGVDDPGGAGQGLYSTGPLGRLDRHQRPA
jgi:hypothetical protein